MLDELARDDGELAEEVRLLLFTFEDVVKLDDRSIQMVLKEVDQKDLAIALRGVEEAVRRGSSRTCPSAAPSSSRRRSTSSRRSAAGSSRRRRAASSAVVRRLEDAGAIIISRGSGGGDDELM